MKNLVLSIICFLHFSLCLSQTDCSSPNQLILMECSDVTTYTFTTQGNDITSWAGVSPLSLSGSDELFEVTTGAATTTIRVHIEVDMDAYLLWMGTSCGNTYTEIIPILVGGGECEYTFDTEGLDGPYYFRVDHDNPTDLSVVMSVGFIQDSIIAIVPDTRGYWDVSPNCSSPMFKPEFKISYNEVDRTQPLIMGPLNTTAELCVEIFLENLTGDEGFKEIEFDFGAAYSELLPINNTFSGFYNLGNWVGTQNGQNIVFTFIDTDGNGYGDAPGTSASCLSYTFCFSIKPLTNTNPDGMVNMTLRPDGRGTPYTDRFYKACCPIGAEACCLGGPGTPPLFSSREIYLFWETATVLPIEFTSFVVKASAEDVDLKWEISEVDQVKEFVIERSIEGQEFSQLGSHNLNSTSSLNSTFNFKDKSPNNGVNIYRIVAIGKDGSKFYSSALELSQEIAPELIIEAFPNPVREFLQVQSNQEINSLELFDLNGRLVKKLVVDGGKSTTLDCSSEEDGIYIVSIQTSIGRIQKKIIVN